MTRYGYFLATEEFTPAELIYQAQMAEAAGFDALAVSDHFHPWIEAQGESPFVWSLIGALSQITALPVTSFVSCPLQRMHPAVHAQAAATSAVMAEGRFRFGVGTGEDLNEHILGDHWPETPVRLDMLEEAVSVMRNLFTGRQISHRGTHYRVQNARLYTRPDEPPPIYVAGFGRKSATVAGRIGDGFITMGANGELAETFRESGGGNRPVLGGTKVCWDSDRDRAVETFHHWWPNMLLPGELASVLPNPAHFDQACTMVTPEMVSQSITCGDDVAEHVETLAAYERAGFDEVYVGQVGPRQREFFDAYRDRVLPRLRADARLAA